MKLSLVPDLGSNIGVHSLFVAAMNRNVVALDAVYDNLAFIKASHDRLGVGNIKLIYNSIRSVKQKRRGFTLSLEQVTRYPKSKNGSYPMTLRMLILHNMRLLKKVLNDSPIIVFIMLLTA